MARRLNQLRKSTLSTHDQLTCSSSILSSSPRTPGKKVIKGDPIITGIRLRPFLERETAIDDTSAVQIFENNVICTQNGRPQIFKFTNCFDASANNKDIYDGMIRSAVLASLQGYNTTVLAYGQTASGKSHSIFGSSSEEGILSLSIENLITMNANHHLKFELSFLEIYNEKVTDLLATPTTPPEQTTTTTTKSSSFSKQARTHILNKFVSTSTNNSTTRTLEIREHPLLGPYVPDLKYIQVKTKEDFQNVLNLGNQQRSVASTNANQRSSRSHAIFTIKISRIDIPQSATKRLSFGLNSSTTLTNINKTSLLSNSSNKKNAKQQAIDELEAQAVRLNFVDLAGSEKSQQFNGSKGKNDRFAESIHINQSLSTLRNVIDALSRQQTHIPYRDSNLTYLLKNSLGGDAKTYMLATISPSSTVIDETINTLRYAGLAATITNVPRIKTPHLRHEIDELREENARLKQELFLVKSKSMPSIHSSIPTISKTSLASIDESIQTSFHVEASTSPDEEISNDEKLDVVDEDILAQIENQCRRPKRQRLSEQPLHEIAKVRKIDDTMLHRRLGTILSYVTRDFSITNHNGILVFSNELNINMRMSSSAWMNALEKFDQNVDINSMTKKEIVIALNILFDNQE